MNNQCLRGIQTCSFVHIFNYVACSFFKPQLHILNIPKLSPQRSCSLNVPHYRRRHLKVARSVPSWDNGNGPSTYPERFSKKYTRAHYTVCLQSNLMTAPDIPVGNYGKFSQKHPSSAMSTSHSVLHQKRPPFFSITTKHRDSVSAYWGVSDIKITGGQDRGLATGEGCRCRCMGSMEQLMGDWL